MIAENDIKEGQPIEPVDNGDNIPLQLHKGQLIGDSLGMAGNSLIAIIFNSFTMYYLTTIAHLDGTMLGTMVLIGSILGAVTSFGTGIMIDKFNSRHGKVRPWLLASILPLAVSIILLFSIPDNLNLSTKMIWAGICILLFNIGGSMFTPASGSLIAMATRNPTEVTRLSSGRALGTIIGATIVTLGYVPVVELMGGDQRAYFIVTTVLVVIGSLLMFNQFRTSHENVKTVNRDESGVEMKVPFKDAMKSILKNKYFLIAWLVLFAATATLSLNNATTVYYARYILGDVKLQSLLSMVGAAPALIVFVFLPTLVKKMGVRWIVACGSLLGLIGGFIRLMDTTSVPLAFMGFILSGIGSIPIAALITVLMNSTIDFGEWKSGIRLPGMMMSLAGIATLLAGSLSISGIGWILGATGFDGAAARQSSSAISGILTISIYLPIILATISVVCMLFWKLEKRHPQIVSELRERNGE
ncbi:MULTISPECIES: MFS transporter [Paenibacillus]|uniref:GPH family glycoside/pentoside/hexuronide:cation symporter n=1 Tax=Paenibacillus pabuli TaxID=1472 RepID=A0A855XTH8_9BACL|nr:MULTISPECIES: glycoside-pentoside-hexuronide (GPH):cation symporter [Paenibacillus]PWW38877.1 GPH family glycoside/pentoside/hexuronide:cation symporter [Paenibacillus pabuli]PXW06062.1 GPH family glycoside/pentoside/hexuronide:cation symporter [Paenibacillus taichungensis]